MSEDSHGNTKSRPMLNGPDDDLHVFDELPSMFSENPPQVEGDPWFFHSSEDLVGVDHFLSEPRCNNLGVDVLSFSSIVHQKCYNIQELSVVDYGSVKVEDGVPGSNIQEHREELADGISKATDTMACEERQIARDTCEDYLLDNEFGDEAFKASPTRGSDEENITFKSTTHVSGQLSYGAQISELSMENAPLLEATSDESYSLFDEMSIHELHTAFSNIFGRETTVTDKQWLKCRLSFGLHNNFETSTDLSNIKCPLNSDECNVVQISPTTGAYSGRDPKPLNDLISFNIKPRIRSLTWETCGDNDSTVHMSSEPDQIDTFFSEREDKVISPLTEKRLRKPPKRYIEESLKKGTRHRKRRCGVWDDTHSKVEMLQYQSCKQPRQKRFGVKSLVKEDSFLGNCIQVPFGEPVPQHEKKRTSIRVPFSKPIPKQEKTRSVIRLPLSEPVPEPERKRTCIRVPIREMVPKQETEKGHYSRALEETRLLGWNADSNTESFSTESLDGVSDNENAAGSKEGKCRRKHHIYWSHSEVLKLVEGVSRCGVGRWSEIKKQLFQSSANRTSVDLKDKWRNLLRASCPTLQSKREVQSRRKQGAQAIPKSVQDRVRELAALYPYPKKQGSRALPIIPTKACDRQLIPLPNCCY
ncbi:uncharacterized protein LOC124920681 isoform X2 [Impatiens glandulifera]|uniref:uncharacterized protein LOC124920681 isoform X2 n=1 Tax=Impatiens glandulifera TaxID=253017 RepID=UPI001FB0EB21|nr:uncharacterized protein LOC124920681 isoform X2 [Impatiens glandulifera]